MPASFAKVLIFVALVCSAAESMSERGLHALDKLNAPHVPLSVKRSLRSDAGLPVSEFTLPLEKTSLFIRTTDSLESTVMALKRFLMSEKDKQILVDGAFTRLGFNEMSLDNVLSHENFSKWLREADKLCKNDDESMKFIYSTLERLYTGDSLLHALTQSSMYANFNVQKLLGVQVQRWIQAAKTEQEVFTILKLDQKGKLDTSFFRKHEFKMWAYFVTQKIASVAKNPSAEGDFIAEGVMRKILVAHFGGEKKYSDVLKDAAVSSVDNTYAKRLQNLEEKRAANNAAELESPPEL